ncbi:hypothetical protein H4582DRAFT_1990166, partial [Lactarius indigo]
STAWPSWVLSWKLPKPSIILFISCILHSVPLTPLALVTSICLRPRCVGFARVRFLGESGPATNVCVRVVSIA